MKLIPADDRIIALQTKPETKTNSGLLLSTGVEIKPPTCTVVSVGKDIHTYKPGDIIMFAEPHSSDSTFRKFVIDDEEYVFLKQADVMAKVEG
ncbi:co-chaperone GroES [Candidatus Saccharibacteria bacterium]|nr:co-chaperone GroES [Candidatus Saccharibacteria bacterium]